MGQGMSIISDLRNDFNFQNDFTNDIAGWQINTFPTQTDFSQSIRDNLVQAGIGDLYGTPNTTVPRTNDDGKVIGDRTYGPDGRADVDTDYTNHGNPKRHPKVPHKHKWDWSDPEHPDRRTIDLD